MVNPVSVNASHHAGPPVELAGLTVFFEKQKTWKELNMAEKINLDTRTLLGFRLETDENLKQAVKQNDDNNRSYTRNLSSKLGGKPGSKVGVKPAPEK